MIIADIPTCGPDSRFSGYSRGGRWYIVLECEGYVATRDPCEVAPFSRPKIAYQYLQATKSVEAQKELRARERQDWLRAKRDRQELETQQKPPAKRSPGRPKSPPKEKPVRRAVEKSIASALEFLVMEELDEMKHLARKAAGRKAAAARWGKKI